MPNKTNDIFRKAYEKMCAYLDAHHMNHTTERFTILQFANILCGRVAKCFGGN